ncbi:MAG TPA: hypothetical protein VFH34_16465 [Anaerolineales bacterium]|nr:hypothetical protein [Anaerolineales bacterium]
MSELLEGKTILVTGEAKRLGKIFTLACARAGAYHFPYTIRKNRSGNHGWW